jgi:intein/homing endonuclease
MNIKKINKIELTPKTAYLTAVIIGDGNLSNYVKSKSKPSPDYRIIIDVSDKGYLCDLSKLFKTIINTKSIPRMPIQRGRRKPRLYFAFRNKSLFYFFHKDMEIPKGKKSSIVFIPRKIKESSLEIKKAFLAGYFDTDGGFRGNSLGFTTASKRLNIEVSTLLSEFKIEHSLDSWVNNKYKKEFYGIRIRKKEIDNFLNTFPFQNKEKLIRISQRFSARMPERSNGIDYSNQFLD